MSTVASLCLRALALQNSPQSPQVQASEPHSSRYNNKMRVRGLRLAAATLCVFAALGDAQVRGLEGGNKQWRPPPRPIQETRQQVQVESSKQSLPSDKSELATRRHRPMLQRSPPHDLRPQRQLQKTESLASWFFESVRDYWNYKQKSKREDKEKKDEEAKKKGVAGG